MSLTGKFSVLLRWMRDSWMRWYPMAGLLGFRLGKMRAFFRGDRSELDGGGFTCRRTLVEGQPSKESS